MEIRTNVKAGGYATSPLGITAERTVDLHFRAIRLIKVY